MYIPIWIHSTCHGVHRCEEELSRSLLALPDSFCSFVTFIFGREHLPQGLLLQLLSSLLFSLYRGKLMKIGISLMHQYWIWGEMGKGVEKHILFLVSFGNLQFFSQSLVSVVWYDICSCHALMLLGQGEANYSLQIKKDPPIFVNKVLLEHHRDCSLVYYLWPPSCFRDMVE